MAELLPFVAVETNKSKPADALVVWLHGLGDSGHGFAPIVEHLNLPKDLSVRFVFPHAPNRAITANNNMVMPGWYDIFSFSDGDIAKRADEKGVKESAEQILSLIDDQLQDGIAPERMILAGFSQGGVMAYHIGTRLPYQIAGIMALSTYLSAPDKLADEVVDVNKKTPIFSAHGTSDDIVPYSAGKNAADTLSKLGFNIEWHDYPMQHNVCPQQIMDIGAWIKNILA
ncbi:dienelactone hydrolase family protein [Catenovulum sp. SM1970]|uniref:alpha/beta hydrolase n=1 Tax=Marinifaba aquimaris TaxID=2741323 RepID=UPI001571FEBC|nr:dienelactone hydrolase family protein [Marinifaba aquimaris]NTS76754.1 dienelactone hydrolase family protein [Marinifaba aquimaris]